MIIFVKKKCNIWKCMQIFVFSTMNRVYSSFDSLNNCIFIVKKKFESPKTVYGIEFLKHKLSQRPEITNIHIWRAVHPFVYHFLDIGTHTKFYLSWSYNVWF